VEGGSKIGLISLPASGEAFQVGQVEGSSCPRKRAIQVRFAFTINEKDWIPACAGMTEEEIDYWSDD